MGFSFSCVLEKLCSLIPKASRPKKEAAVGCLFDAASGGFQVRWKQEGRASSRVTTRDLVRGNSNPPHGDFLTTELRRGEDQEGEQRQAGDTDVLSGPKHEHSTASTSSGSSCWQRTGSPGRASKMLKHHTTEAELSQITCNVSASGAVCSSRATSKNSLLMMCLLLT